MGNPFELADVVEDRITKFSGTVVAITHWIDGTTQIGVQSSELFEGKPISIQWFDSSRLTVLGV